MTTAAKVGPEGGQREQENDSERPAAGLRCNLELAPVITHSQPGLHKKEYRKHCFCNTIWNVEESARQQMSHVSARDSQEFYNGIVTSTCPRTMKKLYRCYLMASRNHTIKQLCHQTGEEKEILKESGRPSSLAQSHTA